MLGVLFALISTASFSFNTVMVRRGVVRASASAGAFVTVLMGVPMFAVAALVSGQLFRAAELPGTGYILLSAAGILHFGFGRYCNYRAVGAIGATRVAPVQSFTIPYSVFIAFLFLGETINWGMAVGIGLILVGPAIMIERASTQAPKPQATPSGGSDAEPAFELRQAEGYLFALLSIGAYGTSPLLIRAALVDLDNMAVYGGLVAYFAAATALILTLVIPARRGLITAMRFSTVRLFLGAGFFVFLAQMFRFAALSIAPVAVVSPLQRSGAIFTLGLSWAVNRKLEKITWRVVLGIFTSTGGAVLLILARFG
jgi:drug/metabolite transporter (DMT)-like permease